MTKPAAIKVQKNQHGNLRGFVGKECVELFGDAFSGDAEYRAREWIKEKVAQGHVLSAKSYITLAD